VEKTGTKFPAHVRPVVNRPFALGAGRTEAAAQGEGALPFARRSREGPSSQVHVRPVVNGSFALGAGRTEAAANVAGSLPCHRRLREGPSSQVDLPRSRPLCGRAAVAHLLRCGPLWGGRWVWGRGMGFCVSMFAGLRFEEPFLLISEGGLSSDEARHFHPTTPKTELPHPCSSSVLQLFFYSSIAFRSRAN